MALHTTHSAAGAAASRAAPVLHPEGLYRWRDIESRIPYSREGWRQLIKRARAPKPATQGEIGTTWRGSDILAWLADPVGYRAGHNANENTE